MEKILKKLTYTLMTIAIMFIFFISSIVGGGVGVTYAATSSSEVLADLERDTTFNKDEYLYSPERTDLEVITIAEGEGDQLFIYVYNPSMNPLYNATYVRLSLSIGENYAPEDYGLTLVSSSGVFEKYYVKNLTVKSYSQRFYDIPCIFRKFIKDVDVDCKTETKNNVEQVSYEVAKCFTATTLNGEVTYTCEATQVVTITDKYVFNGKYPDGFEWYGIYLNEHKTVAHFVAFSTDWDISSLYEIDIKYTTCTFTHRWQESADTGFKPFNEEFELGEESSPIQHTIYAQDENGNDIVVSNPGDDSGWLFGHTYTWKRVQSASSFIDSLDNNKIKLLDGTALSSIENKQWVVAFTETEYTHEDYAIFPTNASQIIETGQKVENVTLMRLKFKCDGIIYNLGVVDNYQTGSLDSIYEGKNDIEILATQFKEFWDMFVKIILAIVAVVLIVLLLNFVPAVKVVLQFIFKLIVFVLSAPFKILKSIFKKDG